VSCDTCVDYIPLSPSESPSKSLSPSSKPTLSPSISLMPSQNPSEIPSSSPTISQPNLIMIITDEHNFRTLGCYRKYLRSIGQTNQTGIWGKNWVYTTNIDRLAEEGVLFSNFYSVAPLCTPSRASFVSGLYPDFTGASGNKQIMNDDIITFAQILKDQENYSTSYIGKWHLDGVDKPGWNKPGRKFGFDRTRFKYNRGHWKYFDASSNSEDVYAYTIADEGKFEGNLEQHFGTDFLFDRGIDDIDEALNENKNFAIMLSIPDPHGKCSDDFMTMISMQAKFTNWLILINLEKLFNRAG
jgi:arylsulfatase A-like enzyme